MAQNDLGGINNRDGPFSNLLRIGHMTGGSVILPMCNNPTLLQIATKTEAISQCGWLFLAHLKLIEFHICWQVFSNRWGWAPLPARNLLTPRSRKIPPVDSPNKFLFATAKGQFPLLNNNFHVITH